MYTVTKLPDGEIDHVTFHGSAIASTVVEYVVGGVFAALLAGAVTLVVGKAILGRKASGAEVAETVRGRAWPLLVASLAASLGPFVPFLAVAVLALIAAPAGDSALAIVLIVGIPSAIGSAFYLWGKLTLVVPAFVLERIGVRAAVTRSWRLVRGAFWRTWGLRALVYLIVGIASAILTTIFGFVGGVFGGSTSIFDAATPPLGAAVARVVGEGAVWMLVQPLVAAALTLIYVDRRMRAEAFGIQLAESVRAGRV